MADPRADTRIGDIEPYFKHPQLDSSGSGISAEHEILPTSEDADGPVTVIQPLGREARSFTLSGDCYLETANALDRIEGDIVELIHARHSGFVYVESVDTSPQSVQDDRGRRYTYRLSLAEARNG